MNIELLLSCNLFHSLSMKRGFWDEGEEEEDDDDDERAMSEEREAESIFGDIEVCSKDLESQLTIDLARQEGPATAKAGSVPLTEEQEELVFNLAYSGHSYNSIMEIMGLNKGAIDRLELIQVMNDAQVEMVRDGLPVGEHGSERLQAEIGTK